MINFHRINAGALFPALFLLITNLCGIYGTSSKQDFLTLAIARVDPIVGPLDGYSSHMHTFFGANFTSYNVTLQDLLSAKGNTGNVLENKSLYWYPTIYHFNLETRLFEIAEIWFHSAYYAWVTNETRAFPEGFRMISGGDPDIYGEQDFNTGCTDPGPCPGNDCSTFGDYSTFFPKTSCKELQLFLKMPECWDGVNLDSADHRSHVAHAQPIGLTNGTCPTTHPVKLPTIRVFTRIYNYKGGYHIFSDGTQFMHADYISGWNETFLQAVLNSCSNPSMDADPDAFCGPPLTFTDIPAGTTVKESAGVDEDIVLALQAVQPPSFDTSSFATEQTNNLLRLQGNPTMYLASQLSSYLQSLTGTSSPTTAPTIQYKVLFTIPSVDISEVDATFISTMKDNLASLLNVAASIINLTFAAGSVVATVTFTSSSASGQTPQALAQSLNSQGSAAISTQIGYTVTGVTSNAVSPTPQSSDGGSDSGGGGDETIPIIAAVVGVVVAIAVGGFIYYRCHQESVVSPVYQKDPVPSNQVSEVTPAHESDSGVVGFELSSPVPSRRNPKSGVV
mmetsp:Transcript_39147/g.62717  ORF Transcript_39147/g.62717 Transcript_39147/m.62717 type:complete len:563 (+) Transcript_39147:37-1725(+)